MISLQVNTYQSIAITDGTRSYAVFIYKCDLIEIGDVAIVGFAAESTFYANHNLSHSDSVGDIDCVNRPRSDWNNVVFEIALPPLGQFFLLIAQ